MTPRRWEVKYRDMSERAASLLTQLITAHAENRSLRARVAALEAGDAWRVPCQYHSDAGGSRVDSP